MTSAPAGGGTRAHRPAARPNRRRHGTGRPRTLGFLWPRDRALLQARLLAGQCVAPAGVTVLLGKLTLGTGPGSRSQDPPWES